MKNISVKVPSFGMALSVQQRDWGKQLVAANKVESLHDYIIQQLHGALTLQQKIGVVEDSKNKKGSTNWKANPQFQLLIMRFRYDGREGTIFSVLIPTMADQDNLQYAASILLETPDYFIEVTKAYGLDLNKMQYDESIAFLLEDLNNPIVDHIRQQIDKYEQDPMRAIVEDRILADGETLDEIRRTLNNRGINHLF